MGAIKRAAFPFQILLRRNKYEKNSCNSARPVCGTWAVRLRQRRSSRPPSAPPQQSIIESPTTEHDTAPSEPVEEILPWSWPTDTPENQGLNQAALDTVHATFDTFPLLSSVIVKNGYLIDTYCKDGYADQVFVLNSASKSITSALIGIAIDQGYIEDVTVPLSDYFPQVLEFDDTAWQQITIWHLLTHTSGILTTDDSNWEAWRSADNWIDYILELPIVSTPGDRVQLFHRKYPLAQRNSRAGNWNVNV